MPSMTQEQVAQDCYLALEWSAVKLATSQVITKGGLHQPHLNRHLANGHLTLSSHYIANYISV